MFSASSTKAITRAAARSRQTFVACQWLAASNHCPHGEAIGVRRYTSPPPAFNIADELLRLTRELDAAEEQQSRPAAGLKASSSKEPINMLERLEEEDFEEQQYGMARLGEVLPPSRMIFLANLPKGATEDLVIDLLERHGCEGIVHTRLKSLRGHCIGYGWVHFNTLKNAKHAMHTIDQLGLRFNIFGRAVKACYSNNPVYDRRDPVLTNRLFVGRFSGTPEQFYDIFDRYKDHIRWVTLRQYRDPPKEVEYLSYDGPLHYGFVVFDTIDNASFCLRELNKKEALPGVYMHVGYADERGMEGESRGLFRSEKDPSTNMRRFLKTDVARGRTWQRNREDRSSGLLDLRKDPLENERCLRDRLRARYSPSLNTRRESSS